MPHKHKPLIDSLCQDLCPVRPRLSPLQRTAVWSVVSLLWIVVVVDVVLGLRDNFDGLFQNPMVQAEAILSFFLGITSAYAANVLATPEGRDKMWVVVPPLLLAGGLATLVLVSLMGHMHAAMTPLAHPIHGLKCFAELTWMALGGLVLMVLLLRRGACVTRGWAGFMGMLAGLSFAYLGLRLTCGSDAPAHLFVWHFMPVVLAVLAGGLVLRRLLRW